MTHPLTAPPLSAPTLVSRPSWTRTWRAWSWPALTLLATAGCALASWQYYGTIFRGWDGQMYYAQLRSLLIDGDLHLANEIFELTPGRHVFFGPQGYADVLTADGQPSCFYTSGWALMNLPAFLTAHLLAQALGWNADGYSPVYQFAILAWQIGLLTVGLWCLADAARRLCGLQPGPWLAVGVLATNIVAYVAIFPLMNHIASFAVVSALVRAAVYLRAQPDHRRSWLMVGLLTGLLVLLRPTDLVLGLLFLPAAWPLLKQHGWKQAMARWLWPLIAVVLALGIQAIAWRALNGYWTLNAYASQGYGFHWLRPSLLQFLFSPNGGGMYAHPFYLVAILTLPWLAQHRHKEQRMWAATVAAGVSAAIYVYASWYCWWFGAGFGNRIYVNFAPLLILAWALAIHQASPTWQRRLHTLGCLLIFLNVLSLIGYVLNLYPPGPRSWTYQLQGWWNTLHYIATRL